MNMRIALGLLCISTLLAAQGIPREDYKGRRAELRKSLDGVMVLFGAEEPEDLHAGFFQESNFLYLSGWKQPGAVMMLSGREEILFLPPHDARGEIFTGRKLGPEDADAKETTGFDKVLPASALESSFFRLLESSKNVYTLTSDLQAQKLHQLSLYHTRMDAGPPIARLRMVKSPAEIDLIQHSTDVTVAAHRKAWSMMKSGLYEYQIAAAMSNVYFDAGCERSAYAPIVGSGPNSVILHYMANRRRVDSGEVVLMDVGAECSGYATDVTRTVPTNGKFSRRQREIYDIVLGAQKAAIAAIKPGVRMRGEPKSLYEIAMQYINTHGKDLHGDPLGKYFTHGLGHHVGLDVHDPQEDVPLRAGMVITIEPGIYIPEENLGVRIEDTLLVTEDGSKNLSGALPREASEIEKLVGK
jgi:Xaa-Pro aminopeptidase